MIKNIAYFYEKQPKISFGSCTATILINESPYISDYEDITDDGSPMPIKRQMFKYDSYTVFIGQETEYAPHNEKFLISKIKEILIKEISDYDVSTNVNVFYLYGHPMWLPDVKRTSLIKSTNIRKAQGNEVTTLWDDNNNKYDIPCDAALMMLNTLEMYALDCYNQTAQHKKNVLEMDSVEDLLNYDITSGYPNVLHLPEDLYNS